MDARTPPATPVRPNSARSGGPGRTLSAGLLDSPQSPNAIKRYGSGLKRTHSTATASAISAMLAKRKRRTGDDDDEDDEEKEDPTLLRSDAGSPKKKKRKKNNNKAEAEEEEEAAEEDDDFLMNFVDPYAALADTQDAEGSGDESDTKETNEEAANAAPSTPRRVYRGSSNASGSSRGSSSGRGGDGVGVDKQATNHTTGESKHDFLVQNSFGGSRKVLDQLQFLVEGLSPAQGNGVRNRSALKLVKQVTSSPSTVCVLLRSTGGFETLFANIGKEPTPFLSFAGVAILFTACQHDSRNIPGFGVEGASLLIRSACTGDDSTINVSTSPATPSRSSPSAAGAVAARQRRRGARGRNRFRRTESDDEVASTKDVAALLDLSSLAATSSDDEQEAVAVPVFAVACAALALASQDTAFAGQVSVVPQSMSLLVETVAREWASLRETGRLGAFRALRMTQFFAVLENLTHVSADTQRHLLTVDGDLGKVLLEVVATACTPPDGDDGDRAVVQLLPMCCRLLVNLTHNNLLGIGRVRRGGGIKLFYNIVRSDELSADTAEEDVQVLALGILINCCEQSPECRKELADAVPFLVELFLSVDDQHRDAKTSYGAVLLGLLLASSRELRGLARDMMPSKTFAELVSVLSDLVLVQSSANMLTRDSLDSTLQIIAKLKNHDEEEVAKAQAQQQQQQQ